MRVQGTICHRVGTLLPIESSTRSTAQLYDMEVQENLQCCVMDGWDREIVATVQRVRSHVNTCFEMFLGAGEFIRNLGVLSVRLATDETAGVDLRTHNCPSYNEVAAIVLDNVGAEGNMMLHQRGGELGRISDTVPAYDPLHFPLLFPHGEIGWHLAVPYQGDASSHNSNRFSSREFCLIPILPQGQQVLVAASRCKIIYAPVFHTTEMHVPSLPGSLGTSRLVLIIQ